MSTSDYTEYILRFSYGKDSFKTLDVIWTRGLPLDRITTTDVWATDTVPAWLPPMQEFKDRMDEWIWDKYRLQVEHLCARNKDGSKRTYEQMFYHVPVRRSQSVQVERERRAPARLDPRIPGSLESVVPIWTQAKCEVQRAGDNYRIPSQHGVQLLPEAQDCANTTSRDSRWQRESPGVKNSRSERRPQGFPAQISSWCKKLKIDYVQTLSQ